MVSIQKVAHLARISLKEDEGASLEGDIKKILDWVEQLEAVDVEGYAPATHPTAQRLILREDMVSMENTPEELLQNAPQAQMNMFAVPKVVE